MDLPAGELTRDQAELLAREHTADTGALHLAQRRGREWVVVRTSLAAPVRPDGAGPGSELQAPADHRPSLLRDIPPYGAG